jgi:ferredoxin
MSDVLRVNPIACDAHGLCAELVPELIQLDEWGYPIVAETPVPARLAKHAKRAVAACPALALMLAQRRGSVSIEEPCGSGAFLQGNWKAPDRWDAGCNPRCRPEEGR